jgi:hypothetical protein
MSQPERIYELSTVIELRSPLQDDTLMAKRNIRGSRKVFEDRHCKLIIVNGRLAHLKPWIRHISPFVSTSRRDGFELRWLDESQSIRFSLSIGQRKACDATLMSNSSKTP